MSVAPVSSVPPVPVTIGVRISFPSGSTSFSLATLASTHKRSLFGLLGRRSRLHRLYLLRLPLEFGRVVVSPLALSLSSSRVVISIEPSVSFFVRVPVVGWVTWSAHFVIIWRLWRFLIVYADFRGGFVIYFRAKSFTGNATSSMATLTIFPEKLFRFSGEWSQLPPLFFSGWKGMIFMDTSVGFSQSFSFVNLVFLQEKF